MKLLRRNLRPVHYMAYAGKEAVTNADGFETGEYRIKYGPLGCILANVSPATGTAQTEQFGNLTGYDKVVMTDEMCSPITEETVLFVDKAPETDADGKPLYDYVVRRIARSENSISYAVQKVDIR